MSPTNTDYTPAWRPAESDTLDVPRAPSPFPTQVHVSIPKLEWDAHVAKVNACVELLNGLVGALANHPMLGAMIPQDVLNILAKAS